MTIPLPSRNALLILATILAALPAFPCEYVAREFRVGHTFTLAVKDRGQPIVGLPLELRTAPRSPSEKSRIIATKASDAAGEVRFTALKTGDYYLTIKHPAVSDEATIHVLPNGARGAVLEWPGNVTVVSALAGGIEMAKADTPPAGGGSLDQPTASKPVEYVPVPDAKFTLAELMNDRPLASAASDQSGSFQLAQSARGTYILHVQVPPKPGVVNTNFSIPVEIKPGAKDRMTIRLTASCDSYEVVTGQPPMGAFR